MPHEDRVQKQIRIGSSSESGDITSRKLYRAKIDGDWYEGRFSRQWFGWQFEGYRSGIQLNLIEEMYELVEPNPRKLK